MKSLCGRIFSWRQTAWNQTMLLPVHPNPEPFHKICAPCQLIHPGKYRRHIPRREEGMQKHAGKTRFDLSDFVMYFRIIKDELHPLTLFCLV